MIEATSIFLKMARSGNSAVSDRHLNYHTSDAAMMANHLSV